MLVQLVVINSNDIIVGAMGSVDGSVALVAIGAGNSIDTTNVKAPIVAFVLDQKGPMYNLTLE